MSDRYIPALGFAWLTSFYDPVVRWTTREATFKTRLVEQADLSMPMIRCSSAWPRIALCASLSSRISRA